ncbi:MAG: ribonuclease H-like domain-containing protein [Candidatus Lernaella stagnicola]|nr:ribonuclease H-like domain-containing protein [Candidatus Lernaella stagnicola]
MSVVDRLKRLTGENADAEQREKDAKQRQLENLRGRIERILERRPGAGATTPSAAVPDRRLPPLGLNDVASGREYQTPHGPVFVVEDDIDVGEFWGRRRLREFAALNTRAAALLARDGRVAEYDPADALFLDTETTGLSGGTGTFAFLIGLGWVERERFVTRLIFARDFLEEAAALHTLTEFAAQKKYLITFNGRTFDVPLLTTRFVLNRAPDSLADLPHLDLLAPARRLLGHRLPNSRLTTLEAEVLGVRRDGDIPGSEIPQRYFDFLHTRDARLVADILKHNRLDVVSMAVLAAHMSELLTHGPDTPDAETDDVVAAARLHLLRGDPVTAERFLCKIVAADPKHQRDAAGRELSMLFKRSQRAEPAVALWREMLVHDSKDLFAGEELAKHLEHRERRFREAIAVVQRLLAGCPADEKIRAALAHRLARLQRKAEKDQTE